MRFEPSRPLPSLLILMLALLVSSPALSWSRFGHEVTGHLADHGLGPAARAAVSDLLGEETLAGVAAWADQVRPQRPETAPLHYMNGPVAVLIPGADDFGLAHGNVHSAVLGYAERIVDDQLPRSERVEALKFFVHFVGDLHQPLHAGFAEDRGANDVPVLYRGELINLHRYWDNEILGEARLRFDSGAYAAVLYARFGDHQRAQWAAVENPRDWVVEARRLIFNGLYPRPRSDAATAEHALVAVVDDSYADVWRPLAERQLARAGARLAWALNQLFETGESPFAAPPIPFPPSS